MRGFPVAFIESSAAKAANARWSILMLSSVVFLMLSIDHLIGTLTVFSWSALWSRESPTSSNRPSLICQHRRHACYINRPVGQRSRQFRVAQCCNWPPDSDRRPPARTSDRQYVLERGVSKGDLPAQPDHAPLSTYGPETLVAPVIEKGGDFRITLGSDGGDSWSGRRLPSRSTSCG
jgi:hypothetical protein